MIRKMQGQKKKSRPRSMLSHLARPALLKAAKELYPLCRLWAATMLRCVTLYAFSRYLPRQQPLATYLDECLAKNMQHKAVLRHGALLVSTQDRLQYSPLDRNLPPKGMQCKKQDKRLASVCSRVHLVLKVSEIVVSVTRRDKHYITVIQKRKPRRGRRGSISLGDLSISPTKERTCGACSSALLLLPSYMQQLLRCPPASSYAADHSAPLVSILLA